jgi:hypothetical protein
MARTFLIRGMLCGLIMGLVVFAIARIFGEPNVDGAIGVEDHLAQMAGEAPEPALVSRAVQASWGLFVGVMLYSIAVGGLFSLLFSYAWGRMGQLGPRAGAAILAALSFITVYLVPFAKYPANPPSVGNPDTIGVRTELYFGMMVIAIVAMIAAVSLGRALLDRLGAWNAWTVAGLGFFVLAAAAYLLLPAINEVPEVFPATLLWQFRTVAFTLQLLLWGGIGLLFGYFTERQFAAKPAPARRRAA